ncbi:MAG: FG-GAP repeat protein [Planctomycetes bacterium]|nr:FG-GAP repeat protein [Planctomycetota bacterium]
MGALLVLLLCARDAAAQHDAHRIFTFEPPRGETSGFGYAAAIAGDVDRDGCADVILGSPYANQGNGAAYVYSGRSGALLHTLRGQATGQLGFAVSTAGDVDRDGHADVVVGEWTRSQALVFSGRTGALLLTLAAPVRLFGYSVGDAGDVNRDGYADVIVGSLDNQWVGYAAVFSGRNGALLYAFRGDSPGDQFGISVDGAGDTDSDGYPDLVVGAPRDDNTGTDSGMIRIFSGKDGSVLRSIDGRAAGELLGYWVSGGGDVDRDSAADVVASAAGANRVDTYSGRSGRRIWAFTGDRDFGWTCSGAGDVDADGYADVVAGRWQRSSTKDPGSCTVISGRTGQALLNLAMSVAGVTSTAMAVRTSSVVGGRRPPGSTPVGSWRCAATSTRSRFPPEVRRTCDSMPGRRTPTGPTGSRVRSMASRPASSCMGSTSRSIRTATPISCSLMWGRRSCQAFAAC